MLFSSTTWSRRCFVIRAACVVLVGWLGAVPALAVEGFLVTVTANPGQIMDGAKVLARVPRGTRLWVLEEKAGWLNVNDPKADQRGWISESAVQEVTFSAAQQRLLKQSEDHYAAFEQQYEKDQFREARQSLEATLRLERQVYGAHPDMTVTLADLSQLLSKLGEHAAAQQAGEEALALRRQLLGSKHLETALMAAQLGEQLTEVGDYAAARKLLNESLSALRAEAPEAANTALVINSLGNVELSLANHAQAQALYDEALAILRKTNEDQDESVALVTNNLGLLAMELGDYGTARKHLEEALALTRKVYGEEHSELSLTLNNLGLVADQQGDLPEARRLYEESLRILRKVYGDKNYNTALTLSNLGMILFQQGDFAGARRHYDEALSIYRATYKTPHANTAMVLFNLGRLVTEQKDFAAARKFLDEALSISRAANGLEHNYTAAVLYAQAELAVRENDLPRAQKLFEEALALYRKALGEQHPETASIHNALAQLAMKRGDYTAAWKILDANLGLAQRLFGKDHPITATVLGDLAKLAVLEGDADEAQRRWDEVRRVERRYTQYLLSSLSPLEQLRYLEHQYQPSWFQCLTFGFDQRENSAAANMSATWLINGKAIAQEALAERELIARDLSNPKLAPLVKDLQQVRQRLASLSLSSPKAGEAAAHQAKILELGNEEYRLAQALAQENGRETISRTWIELTALRRSLSPEAIYLDLVRMPLHDFKSDKDGPPHYLVWIIPPHARGSVQIVDLGLAEPIDAAVEQMREVIAKAAKKVGEQGEAAAAAEANPALSKLAELILAPLLPHLGDAKVLILSPDGPLWLVPWAALPTRDQQPLLAQHSIRLILSGRDLVKDQTKPKLAAEAPLIVVDPNYDLAGTAAKKAVQALLPKSTEEPETTRGVTSTSSLPQVAALPFTALEGQITRPLVEKLAGQAAKLFEQDAALETVVKKSPRPKLLYFATHGFFLPDQEVQHRDDLSLGSKTPALTADNKLLENPLLRCGLMFAGCNAERTAGLDDGILTGLEIVGMDLRGTELVVLSACETGVGKVRNGEGVAGLRQAFQLAGAQSVVSTLWPVTDRDSALIMQDFFTNLAAGQSKADALRNAQLKRIEARKEKSGAAHPFFWAAWTVTGE